MKTWLYSQKCIKLALLTNLNEEELWLPHQTRTAVSSEVLRQGIEPFRAISAVYHALISMTKHHTHKWCIFLVVLLRCWKHSRTDGKQYVLLVQLFLNNPLIPTHKSVLLFWRSYSDRMNKNKLFWTFYVPSHPLFTLLWAKAALLKRLAWLVR